MRSTLILACAGSLLLSACSREPAAPAADAAAPDAAPTADHVFKPEIDADDLRTLVTTLASDEFEGRAPGSAG